MQLAQVIQAEFRVPVMINLMNGRVLTLMVPGDAEGKISDDARREFTFRLARFARAHYAHAAQLDSRRLASPS